MKNRILLLREDYLEEILEELAKQNPCPECGDTTQAKHVVNRFWRGFTVTCQKCGGTVEIDEPEKGLV